MKSKFITVLIFSFLIACSTGKDSSGSISQGSNGNTGNSNGNNNSGDSDWLIPVDEVKDGGPGKDGIPSIDNPKFLDVSDTQTSFIENNDLVIGIKVGDEIRAYPHLILDWHEIVNDQFNTDNITLNYCPLTGTAFGWRSLVNGSTSQFGVSGLLYNANLILYDRNTDSRWSQLKLQCVNGPQIGDFPELHQVIETNWETWKLLYPNSKVLSTDTGFQRNYDVYPYGTYKTDNNYFIFTASPTNDALPNKERVFALINNSKSKVYQFNKFTGGRVVVDQFEGTNFLIVGNENLITAFELDANTSNLNFSYNFNNSEVFFSDNQNNNYTVFGEKLGSSDQLKPAKSVVSYWFAIAAFYPNPLIFEN